MAMDLRSLVPYRGRAGLMRPEVALFGSLQREVDRLFEDFTRGVPTDGGTMLLPNIDVSETDNEIDITVDLPGLDFDDVEISFENDTLTIRGEKTMESRPDEQDGKGRTYHVAERTYGVFYRGLQLPPGIDPSQVEATMSNGVLRIRIPKPTQNGAAKIEVRQGQGNGQAGAQGRTQASTQAGTQGAQAGTQADKQADKQSGKDAA